MISILALSFWGSLAKLPQVKKKKKKWKNKKVPKIESYISSNVS